MPLLSIHFPFLYPSPICLLLSSFPFPVCILYLPTCLSIHLVCLVYLSSCLSIYLCYLTVYLINLTLLSICLFICLLFVFASCGLQLFSSLSSLEIITSWRIKKRHSGWQYCEASELSPLCWQIFEVKSHEGWTDPGWRRGERTRGETEERGKKINTGNEEFMNKDAVRERKLGKGVRAWVKGAQIHMHTHTHTYTSAYTHAYT